MSPIDFLAAASNDYDESFGWYAARSERAARSFAGAIDDALRRIALNSRASTTFIVNAW